MTVRLVLGFSALLSIMGGTSRASAEPLAPSCRTGLVLGVSEQDAGDVVAAVCSAAKRRGTTGVVRVSVLAAGDKVRVGVARLSDTKESEQTAHTEAATVAQAVRIAPAVLEALESTSSPPPPSSASAAPAGAPAAAPAPAPAPAPPPAPAPAPAPAPVPAPIEPTAMPKEEGSALTAKAGQPAGWVGVHGSSGVAGGGSGFGGGAALGFDHRSVQAYIDYSNSSGSATKDKFEHQMATIGGRLKLSQSSFKPVIGGGWSYVDYERGEGLGRTRGQGIGIFGELGAIYAIEKHQILALARLNLGLYEEKTMRPYSYTNYNGQRVDQTIETSGSGGSISPSFAFLAGYAYVFR